MAERAISTSSEFTSVVNNWIVENIYSVDVFGSCPRGRLCFGAQGSAAESSLVHGWGARQRPASLLARLPFSSVTS